MNIEFTEISNAQKQVEVAKMLGWELYNFDNKHFIIPTPLNKLSDGNYQNIRLPEELLFDLDYNWQFYAIKYIQKTYFYWINVFGYGCCKVEGVLNVTKNPHIVVFSEDIKDAIFEVLYQFSQFIKNEKES